MRKHCELSEKAEISAGRRDLGSNSVTIRIASLVTISLITARLPAQNSVTQTDNGSMNASQYFNTTPGPPTQNGIYAILSGQVVGGKPGNGSRVVEDQIDTFGDRYGYWANGFQLLTQNLTFPNLFQVDDVRNGSHHETHVNPAASVYTGLWSGASDLCQLATLYGDPGGSATSQGDGTGGNLAGSTCRELILNSTLPGWSFGTPPNNLGSRAWYGQSVLSLTGTSGVQGFTIFWALAASQTEPAT